MATPFYTAPNEKSFSALIDAAVLATGKPQSLMNAVQYANLTIKECQSLGLFAPDLVEDVVTATQDNYIWTRPFLFRRLRTVKYMGSGRYPKLRLPGRYQKDEIHFYYSADNYFVFSGTSLNETLALAYYQWIYPLSYYAGLNQNTSLYSGGPYQTRQAFYDIEAFKWQYLNTAGDGYVDTLGDPTLEETYQKRAMHWLVAQWYDMILSGTKAKIWGQAGDSRGPTEYSLYKQMQAAFRTTINYESEDF